MFSTFIWITNLTFYSSFQVIDYLDTTGIFELVIVGPLPLEVPSFKSLWLPFDNTVWIMTILLIAESAFVLSLVDITWRKTITKRHRPAIKDVFEGSRLHRYEVGSFYSLPSCLSFQQSGWYHRAYLRVLCQAFGFKRHHLPLEGSYLFNGLAFASWWLLHIRKTICWAIIVRAFIANNWWSHWSSVLASMLIKPIYRGTIDTPKDMQKVSAKLAILKGSSMEILLKEDPRPAVQELYPTVIHAPIITKNGHVIPDYLESGWSIIHVSFLFHPL